MLAGADDVERLAEAGRRGGQLARAVQGRERGLGDAHQTSLGRAELFQCQAENDRVEPHQLGEGPPGLLVREDFREQVHAEPGRAVLLVGSQWEPGEPGASEHTESFGSGQPGFR